MSSRFSLLGFGHFKSLTESMCSKKESVSSLTLLTSMMGIVDWTFLELWLKVSCKSHNFMEDYLLEFSFIKPIWKKEYKKNIYIAYMLN